MLLDPGPGLHIIDINAAYAAATFTARDAIVLLHHVEDVIDQVVR
jgi:hypothetical protein